MYYNYFCDLFSTIYVCVSSCIYMIDLLYLFVRIFISKNILNIFGYQEKQHQNRKTDFIYGIDCERYD